MRPRRVHSLIVLLVCWAQLAQVLAGSGLVQVCVEAGGWTHIEVGESSCCSSTPASAPERGDLDTHARDVSVCECGACTHVPLEREKAIHSASHDRSWRDAVAPRPVSIAWLSAILATGPDIGSPVSAASACAATPEGVGVRRSIILLL